MVRPTAMIAVNAPTNSMESRLPKIILVFVDGRCRVGSDGKAACLRGTFFGGGGKGAHSTLRAMCTPRMMMLGVSCSALAAKNPICVSTPARWVGSRSSRVKPGPPCPATPYSERMRSLANV